MSAPSIDLYRAGNTTTPKLNRVRIDKADPKDNDLPTYLKGGALWVQAGKGGVSVYSPIPTAPPMNAAKHWWRFPAGTALPAGLIVMQRDLTEVDHFLIEPAYDMPLREYVNLLEELGHAFQPCFQVARANPISC